MISLHQESSPVTEVWFCPTTCRFWSGLPHRGRTSKTSCRWRRSGASPAEGRPPPRRLAATTTTSLVGVSTAIGVYGVKGKLITRGGLALQKSWVETNIVRIKCVWIALLAPDEAGSLHTCPLTKQVVSPHKVIIITNTFSHTIHTIRDKELVVKIIQKYTKRR